MARNSSCVIDSILTRGSPRDPHFLLEKCWYQQPQRDQPLTILSYTYQDEEQLYHEDIIGQEEGYLMGFQYVRGLMGFWFSHNGQLRFRIHNPTTRQSIFLPLTGLPGSLFYLFGYDPFKNQYKVLCLTRTEHELSSCKIFILGDVSKEWRDIQSNVGFHFIFEQAICINGTVFYKARNGNGDRALVSFDVRHEKFNLVHIPENMLFYYQDTTLVNYHGKLGCICQNNFIWDAMDMWVMHDAEKQEWSQITFLKMLQRLPSSDLRFAGVTNPGGEIVLVRKDYLSGSALEVYYYDPKQKALRRADIQTTRPTDHQVTTIRAVTDHVNIMRLNSLL